MKHKLLLFLSVIVLISACKNEPAKAPMTEYEKSALDTESTYPLDIPLVVNMHGVWQSKEDATKTLEFHSDNWVMKKDGTVIEESTFKLYKHCPRKCFPATVTSDGGMCFSLVGAQNMVNCYLILGTDGNNFSYRQITDGEPVVMNFKRVGQ